LKHFSQNTSEINLIQVIFQKSISTISCHVETSLASVGITWFQASIFFFLLNPDRTSPEQTKQKKKHLNIWIIITQAPSLTTNKMSSFPKARKSNITNVSVTPEKWDAYPEVSRSTLSDSTFTNLSSATQISTSTIANSTLEDLVNEAKIKNNHVNHSQVQDSAIFSSQIDRSKLENCTVTDSVVNKSTLKHCTVDPRNRVERTTARATKFMGAKVVNRSQLEDSDILSGSTVERCIVRNSVVAEGAVCDRTKMDNAAVTRSRVDRSNLSNCDVMDCVMDRTTFGWMTLRYGIWKNGDLVGRTSTTEEVVIKPRTKPMEKPADLSSSTTEPLPVAQPLRAASPMRESGWKAAEAVCFLHHERYRIHTNDLTGRRATRRQRPHN
jgi:hypothetical protein